MKQQSMISIVTSTTSTTTNAAAAAAAAAAKAEATAQQDDATKQTTVSNLESMSSSCLSSCSPLSSPNISFSLSLSSSSAGPLKKRRKGLNVEGIIMEETQREYYYSSSQQKKLFSRQGNRHPPSQQHSPPPSDEELTMTTKIDKTTTPKTIISTNNINYHHHQQQQQLVSPREQRNDVSYPDIRVDDSTSTDNASRCCDSQYYYSSSSVVVPSSSTSSSSSHHYHDHSLEIPVQMKTILLSHFPIILHRLLTITTTDVVVVPSSHHIPNSSSGSSSSIHPSFDPYRVSLAIEWLPHGRAWRVLRWDVFGTEILPTLFRDILSTANDSNKNEIMMSNHPINTRNESTTISDVVDGASHQWTQRHFSKEEEGEGDPNLDKIKTITTACRSVENTCSNWLVDVFLWHVQAFGFVETTCGWNKGSYSHELFVRDNPTLCTAMELTSHSLNLYRLPPPHPTYTSIDKLILEPKTLQSATKSWIPENGSRRKAYVNLQINDNGIMHLLQNSTLPQEVEHSQPHPTTVNQTSYHKSWHRPPPPPPTYPSPLPLNVPMEPSSLSERTISFVEPPPRYYYHVYPQQHSQQQQELQQYIKDWPTKDAHTSSNNLRSGFVSRRGRRPALI